MSRRANGALRCARCHMHRTLCVCALIPRIETRTRVVLITHRYEDRKPTNSGRLATECLVNSEVLVRGHEGAVTTFTAKDGTEPLLLFPHEDAAPLGPREPTARPVTLVVPDGNWRQASKVRKRVRGLEATPCVMLPVGEARAPRRLRAEAHDYGLATLEAVARALGILEGPEVRGAIEQLFRVMVERTLWSRGMLAVGEVTGGVPDAARLHDWSR